MATKFTTEEIKLLEKEIPEFWFAEDDHLVHPIGDVLEKDSSGGYTLTEKNSFPNLQSALTFLNERDF